MANELSLASLKLSVEERERVAEIAGDLIAIHVYRELQSASRAAARAGCSIVNINTGGCSCSSKEALLQRAAPQ